MGCLLAAPACAEGPGVKAGAAFELLGHRYDLDSLVQLELPKRLREISGLTLTTDGRLLGHDDERGIVYELDIDATEIGRSFALEGAVRADFEGIAAAGALLYLLVSDGSLYRFQEGVDGATVPWERFDETLPCEAEGIAADDEGLWVACKNLEERAKGEGLRLYRWRFDRERYAPSETLSVPRKALRQALALPDGKGGKKGPKKLQPTGATTVAPGRLLILAGRQHVLLDLDTRGEILAAVRLPDPARHAQPEGIAVTDDARILIADEGAGKGAAKKRGRLSVYHPTQH